MMCVPERTMMMVAVTVMIMMSMLPGKYCKGTPLFGHQRHHDLVHTKCIQQRGLGLGQITPSGLSIGTHIQTLEPGPHSISAQLHSVSQKLKKMFDI